MHGKKSKEVERMEKEKWIAGGIWRTLCLGNRNQSNEPTENNNKNDKKNEVELMERESKNGGESGNSTDQKQSFDMKWIDDIDNR